MDKCREEFEAYIVTRYPKRSKEVVTRRLEEIDGYQFYTFKEIEDAWVIWQHQQAKVDDLQVQLKGAEERAQLILQYKDKYRLERDELQKRVDLVKRELNAAKEGHYGFNDEGADIDSFIFDLEQALKGEG